MWMWGMQCLRRINKKHRDKSLAYSHHLTVSLIHCILYTHVSSAAIVLFMHVKCLQYFLPTVEWTSLCEWGDYRTTGEGSRATRGQVGTGSKGLSLIALWTPYHIHIVQQHSYSAGLNYCDFDIIIIIGFTFGEYWICFGWGCYSEIRDYQILLHG